MEKTNVTISNELAEMMRSGTPFRMAGPQFEPIWHYVHRTLSLTPLLNASTDTDQVRARLSDIIGTEIDTSTVIFAPFHTNFGRFTSIGKNVFINHRCSCLDLGGITIEDDVLIGPNVNLITENHPLDPTRRKEMICKPVTIKRNVWIGAAATILPGVTIGENSVVAAGAIVTSDVAPNSVVGGVPARLIRNINS